METWSDELVEAKKNMDTAKYSMSSGALRNEPLSQQIINCGHFLATNNAAGGYSGSVAGDQTYNTGITDDGGIAVKNDGGGFPSAYLVP